MSTFSSTSFIQGWFMTFGLIAAIGAQNALVLRQGLARSHVGPVIAVCIASDWLLIGAGVFGLGTMAQSFPLLMEVFRFGGAAFLIIYGFRSAQRAWVGSEVALQASSGNGSLAKTLATALALTYLNPHVYIDTVLLLGSIGSQHGANKGAFLGGACLASLMWFVTLGYGAMAASRWLQRPSVWRGIDASVALVMGLVAIQLLVNPIQIK